MSLILGFLRALSRCGNLAEVDHQAARSLQEVFAALNVSIEQQGTSLASYPPRYAQGCADIAPDAQTHTKQRKVGKGRSLEVSITWATPDPPGYEEAFFETLIEVYAVHREDAFLLHNAVEAQRASEHKARRADEELHQARAERLTTMRQFAEVQQAIATHQDISDTLNIIAQTTRQVMDSPVVVVQIHRPELFAASGVPPEIAEGLATNGYTSGFGQRAWQQSGAVIDNNFANTHEAAMLGEETIHAALTVPILKAAEPIGYLVVGCYDPTRAYDNLDVALASSLSEFVVLAINDAASQHRLNSALNDAIYQSTRDALTGLANRSLFDQALADLYGQPGDNDHAVMYLDCDFFKNINDTHGHQIGDLVLTTLADRYVACLRDDDVVARLGGDEFAILVYRVGDGHALQQLANRVLNSACRPIVVTADVTITPSVSIGVALTSEYKCPKTVVEAADLALYSAKNAGRRRAVLAGTHDAAPSV